VIEPIRDRDNGADTPRISVVLPVLDGGEPLAQLLTVLGEQEVDGGFELIAVDSGSRDGSLERLLASRARVFGVPRRRFGHGRTRNAAIALARADRVVLLVQDACPIGPDFLAELAAPLEADPALAGAYARQLAPRGLDPLLAAAIDRWTPAGADRRQRAFAAGEFQALAPAVRAARCRFDNVASCIQAGIWRRLPFPDVTFGEDAAWARRVLEAGHDLLYRASVPVIHGHSTGMLAAFTRDRAAHELLAREFGLRSVPDRGSAIHGWLAGWPGDLRQLRSAGVGGAELVHCLGRGALRRAGAIAGQYAGGRLPTRAGQRRPR
jgi:glycosyltransferase involved in cell wall biosynthesis